METHPRFGNVVVGEERIREAKKELTARPDPDRPWVTCTAYQEVPGGSMRVPKFYGAASGYSSPSFSSSRQHSVTLREDLGQADAYRAATAAFETVGGGIVCLPTGHGKTCLAIKLVCDLGLKTLVLCHKTLLVDQWAERLAQFAPGVSVGRIQGDRCELEADIVLATVQTLVSRGHHKPHAAAARDFDGFGLLVFDECHHVAAQVFSSVMYGCSFRYTLGLSATPDRRDGLTRFVEYFLGPVCYRGAMRRERPEVVVRHFRDPAYAAAPPRTRQGTVCYPGLLNALAENPARTSFLADLVREEVRLFPERRVLVLSHRKALCEDLARHVPGAFVYTGSRGKKVRYDADARVVIASWALVSEGFDDPGLDTVILATPSADAVQAIGRVGRSGRRGKIVDVVDEWGPCFAQYTKRKRAYSQQHGGGTALSFW